MSELCNPSSAGAGSGMCGWLAWPLSLGIVFVAAWLAWPLSLGIVFVAACSPEARFCGGVHMIYLFLVGFTITMELSSCHCFRFFFIVVFS
ncbi:hypothetical protein A2U01_0038266 [Trifolium medium]|uniref:Uncharacterized protein n=1 Tax=Trifolium medium TaxID=97028 RepID=A0A392PZX4_9FABA|nr:hypothetical protein [Trifolium medium]